MKYALTLLCLICTCLFIISKAQADEKNRLGVGAHYWRTIDEIESDNFDRDGVSYIATYQRKLMALLKLEADLEFYPKNFGGSSDPAYAPQAYAVVGSGIYGALGIGINYIDDGFADNPFYVLRAGLNLELLPTLYIDINGNYRVESFDKIKDAEDDIDTDVITLGAAARLEF